jgi:ADP-ribosylglycohydrolase
MSGQAGKINNPINDSKGCGTIMRVAPIGLFFGGNSKKAFEVACHFSAITHGHPSGYLSAGFFAGGLSDLTVGIDLPSSIDNALKILENWNNHEETKSAVHAANFYLEKSISSFPRGYD